MKQFSYKYRILAHLAEIAPKALKADVVKCIITSLGVSERTFKRKIYAKIGQDTQTYSFQLSQLDIVCSILNVYRPQGLPMLKIDDLINPQLIRI